MAPALCCAAALPLEIDVNEQMRILLVEDSLGDAHLFEEEARDGGLSDFRVTHASRVDEALRLYEPGAFDIVLLDLNLPDAKGLLSVERLMAAAPSTPVVVLTTLADDSLAEQAIAAGAEDYLVKGECEGWQLARALRHAIARRRRFAGPTRTPEQLDTTMDRAVPQRWFGEKGLRSTLPNVFDDLVGAVADLIDITLRCPSGKEQQGLQPQIQTVASRLAMLTAQPRDVMELHRAATARKLLGGPWGSPAAKARAARQVFVALLAELCLCYRREVLDETGEQAATS
jgi:CheY-like chemotaxis protein